MEHIIDVLHGVSQSIAIGNADLAQVDPVRDLRQILAVAGREVVDHPDGMPVVDQRIDDMRPDKPGSPRHEVGMGCVVIHHSP